MPAGQQRCGLGQPVADGIREPRFIEELFHVRIEFRASDAEESDPSSEELHQFFSSYAV